MAAAAAQWSALRLVNPDVNSSSSNTRRKLKDSCNFSQGIGWMGAAVVGSGVLSLKQGRKQSAKAQAAMGASDGGDEEFAVGDFCPLYSDLESVAFSSSPARKSRGLRSSRGVEAKGIATSVDGGVIVEASRTLSTEQVLPRIGQVSRVTKETSVEVRLNLDGTGVCDCDTGIPFLDHMLDQLASHGLLDVSVKAKGDIHIDDHHTNEDIGLAVGTALLQALGDRKGIYRFGDFSAPLDEALIHVVLDLSGRPYLGYNVDIPTQRVGTYDTQLVEHFFQSVVNTSGMTLHIRKLAGNNSHHIIEATFKAFARALRQALEYDLRRKGSVPSSKGVLSRA